MSDDARAIPVSMKISGRRRCGRAEEGDSPPTVLTVASSSTPGDSPLLPRIVRLIGIFQKRQPFFAAGAYGMQRDRDAKKVSVPFLTQTWRHADFARYFNLRKRSCGHVWQARYFSCLLDGVHLWRAMAHVERNPVRAGMVERPEWFPWSSAGVRLGVGADRGLVDLEPWRAEYTAEQWREVLGTSVAEEAFGRRLQEASRCGRPFGGEEFVEALERRAGRRLRPMAVGRPRRGRVEEAQRSAGNGI